MAVTPSPDDAAPSRPGPVVDPIWHARAQRLVARLRALDVGTLAPRAGQLFPDLALPDARGHVVRLSQLCGEGPIVLSFHRGLKRLATSCA
ncbi:MAG: hypothetical protein WCO11_11840 [Sphingomonadales bacterium]|jgi:hypothetical protein